MSADYADLPPADLTPEHDQYTVTIDGVEFGTPQIEDIDGEAIFFATTPRGQAFRPIAIDGAVEVETPVETFTGAVDMVALEHGELSIRVERREEVAD